MKYDLVIIFLILLFLIIFTFILIKKKYKSNKFAIALLTVKPNVIWLDFLLTFINYYDVLLHKL